MTLTSCNVKRFGNLYEITNHYVFKESTLTEQVIIQEDSRFIEFYHDLDWQNVGYMLRTSFPLSIKTDKATFDIQFGQIERTRLNNTKIDSAQFEVSGHHWVDVSEEDYGVSLINNSKYGFYVKEDLLDMNLLRSTNYPCVNGDIGNNQYRYAIYIHQGNHTKARVDEYSMQMNSFYPIFNKPINIHEDWIEVAKTIQYSTIKGSEDKQGIIIRLYETSGTKTTTPIRFKGLSIKGISHVNLVEEDEQPIDNHNDLKLTFDPFEIITLKLYLH